MKLAYVTTYDPSDVHAWSGAGHYMLKALQAAGFQTEAVGGLRRKAPFLSPLKKVFYSILLSRNYLKEREPYLLEHYASQVKSALANVSHDVVFSPGTLPIAYLQTEKPVVFWTDATFAGMQDFYPDFSNLCAETIEKGNMAEQLALSNCRLAIYCSEWAARTALEQYTVDPKKVKVVTFGANLDSTRSIRDINSIIEQKNLDSCKLLFIGVEWFRKGGDIALRVAELLTQRGIPTQLDIVGCDPPVNLPAYARQHGFISKATAEGRRLLDGLMAGAHFLLLPSRAECCGVVLAEAASFGLPSLAANVGGLSTVIRDGKNGYLFPLDADPEEYCARIQELISSRQKYAQLALSSFREYSQRLNWSYAGRQVYELVQEFCA
jgi:glycosyltransferase involved in cell wall biosynthesis